jgi:predicted nucleotidyltransferase
VDVDRAAVIEALRKHGARFAFVFGSQARGDAREDSDVDVAAWWRDGAPNAWQIVLPAGVDLVVLNGAPLELAGRVALEGDLLFDDDPTAQVTWTATMRKIWLDERPRFEASHRLFLESAARG